MSVIEELSLELQRFVTPQQMGPVVKIKLWGIGKVAGPDYYLHVQASASLIGISTSNYVVLFVLNGVYKSR